MAFSVKSALSPTRSQVHALHLQIQSLESRNSELRQMLQSEAALEAEQVRDLEELRADIQAIQRQNRDTLMQKQALAKELADATAEFQTAIEAVQTEERAGKEELMVAEHRVDTEKMVLQRLSKAHTADIAVLKERIKATSTRITDLHTEISAVKAAKRPLFQWVERALTEIPQEALQQLQSLAKEIS